MKTIRLAAVAAFSLAALAGCVVAPMGPDPYYYDGTVTVAPPAPRVEYPGAAPAVGYVWLGGFWNWSGGHHVWVPGRWEAPRRGQAWVQPRWQQQGSGWRREGGYWAPQEQQRGTRERDRDRDDDRDRERGPQNSQRDWR